MTESGFIEVNGGQLYYEAEGSGHPLVLVHAGVANLRQWDEQVPAFAERYRVIRYDTRGWGRSETDQVEFSNHDDLAAVLDQLGERSAYVLGLSRGGSIVLNFALAYPDRADALIFCAGGIEGFEVADTAEEEATWEEAQRHEEAHDWGWVADFETRFWVDGPGQSADRVDPDIRDRVHDWILTTYQEEKNEGMPQRLSPPANSRLAELRLPTLVMVGDLDERTTQLACHHLADTVAGARFEGFHGAAHMLNLEQPEKFTRLVLEFLAESAPPGS
ncbi:MAG TPA: alpha/beta hydrolase [Candidatus Limnocylindria bacterium]|nr:alpha/beta hydrolase [Candidatus Limnocylindria bacterium]